MGFFGRVKCVRLKKQDKKMTDSITGDTFKLRLKVRGEI